MFFGSPKLLGTLRAPGPVSHAGERVQPRVILEGKIVCMLCEKRSEIRKQKELVWVVMFVHRVVK